MPQPQQREREPHPQDVIVRPNNRGPWPDPRANDQTGFWKHPFTKAWELYHALTPDRVRELLEDRDWVFAQSMPDNPHTYTLRWFWPDPDEFFATVLFIRLRGAVDWWPSVEQGAPYLAVDLGGYHYWGMNSWLRKTWLLNRKKIE